MLGYRRSLLSERKLNETEQKIYQLQKFASDLNKKDNSSRKIIIQHFNILKKTALLEGFLKDDDRKKGKLFLTKFNEIVYGDGSFKWESLYITLNHLYDGLFEKIKIDFPALDQSEFRICCLLFVGFNNQEIAVILDLSNNTISNKRNIIRKKIGVKAYGNISIFFNELYKKQ